MKNTKINKLNEVSQDRLEEIKNMNITSETKFLDFKETFSIRSNSSKLEIVKDMVAFANTQGGHILFGVTKNYEWLGLDSRSDEDIDEAKIQDVLDNYVEGIVEFYIGIHEIDKREFLIMYIEESKNILTFKTDGNYMRQVRGGKEKQESIFKKNQVYCRRGSRSLPADYLFYKQRAEEFSIVHNLPTAPFHSFVGRIDQLAEVHDLLMHSNTRLLQVDGIGGIGKTSLVYHYCDSILSKKLESNFEFIVWTSAKRTIYTPDGERKTRNYMASFQDVINEVLKVLGDPSLEEERFSQSLDEQVEYVTNLLKENNILLIIDNMETLLEEELVDFLFNLPQTSKAVLTTRESISNFQMSKLTLQGLSEFEFTQFIEAEYKRITKDSFEQFNSKLPQLYKLTKGMPLASQLVVNQLSQNTPIDYVIKGLESGKTYETLLEFCFSGSLEKLLPEEVGILYILSMPSTEELLTHDDIKYITGYSDDEIAFALTRLTKFSLCYSAKTSFSYGYTTQHLTKVYVKKYEFADKQILIERYIKYTQERSEIADASILDEQYLISARAKNHEQRLAALSIKNAISTFYLNGHEAAMKLIDNAISKCPDFGYLYYVKAMVEHYSDSYMKHKKAISSLSEATNRDPDLIEAWIMWGYIENEQKQFPRSEKYFAEALKIDPKNPRASHGYAYALFQIAKKKTDSSRVDIAKKAESYYFKAYNQKANLSDEERHHNAINAHSNALNLMINLGDLDGALKVCRKGLQFERHDNKLLTLQGELQKKIKDRLQTPEVQKNYLVSQTPSEKSKVIDRKHTLQRQKEKMERKYTPKVQENLPKEIIEKLNAIKNDISKI